MLGLLVSIVECYLQLKTEFASSTNTMPSEALIYVRMLDEQVKQIQKFRTEFGFAPYEDARTGADDEFAHFA